MVLYMSQGWNCDLSKIASLFENNIVGDALVPWPQAKLTWLRHSAEDDASQAWLWTYCQYCIPYVSVWSSVYFEVHVRCIACVSHFQGCLHTVLKSTVGIFFHFHFPHPVIPLLYWCSCSRLTVWTPQGADSCRGQSSRRSQQPSLSLFGSPSICWLWPEGSKPSTEWSGTSYSCCWE